MFLPFGCFGQVEAEIFGLEQSSVRNKTSPFQRITLYLDNLMTNRESPNVAIATEKIRYYVVRIFIDYEPVWGMVGRPQWPAVQASQWAVAGEKQPTKFANPSLRGQAKQCLEPACCSLYQPSSQLGLLVQCWCYLGGRDCAEYICALYTFLSIYWSFRTSPGL